MRCGLTYSGGPLEPRDCCKRGGSFPVISHLEKFFLAKLFCFFLISMVVGSVMGCFAEGKEGNLVQIESIIDKKMYHKILQQRFSVWKRFVGRGFTFQQEINPKHNSKYCRYNISAKVKQREL